MDDIQLLQALVGSWTTEATHPVLDGPVAGRATFEWVPGEHFLVWRSRHEHPDIPDALAVTGVTDGRLTMHYFDSRGVFRVYEADVSGGTWRFWRDAPGFAQRFTGRFSDDGSTITGHGELNTDGVTWHEDLSVIYRRTA